MAVDLGDYADHVAHFKEHGYTVFSQLYRAQQMAVWRNKLDEMFAEDGEWWLRNTLEYAPKLFWPAVSNPTLLDFAELVMGPFVQLDNLTLAGFRPVTATEARGKVSGWHRDRWSKVPRSAAYQRPNAINAITYLQDLSDEYGPLRVIAGSHRRGLTIPAEQRNRPHPEERVLHMTAGDVCVTHGDLVHSGTPNTSGNIRYFFSIFYNLSWLKHTDTHRGPRTRKLLELARARNDHRQLRLLGEDLQLQPRCNSGFLTDDETRWAEWAAADRAAIKQAVAG
jgi:hypothetical protein